MGRAEDLFERIVQEGAKRIEQMISDEQTEELFLDYKRSADDGAGTRLHDNDRRTLSRAISGFGNSEGGVVVWGVDCRNIDGRGDLPSEARPITQPLRFKAWLEDAVSGLTIPVHSGVRHHPAPISAGDTGFVATLIPRSDRAPHQTVHDQRYLIRSGSNFAPTPHAVLAGMFGRRPQAHVLHKYVVSPPTVLSANTVQARFGVLLRNLGPAVAEDLYLNATIWSFGGKTSKVTIDQPDASFWHAHFNFGVEVSVIAQPHRRLAPAASILPVSIVWEMAPPFTDTFKLDLTYGARGTSVHSFGIDLSKEKVHEAWELIARTPASSGAFKNAVELFNSIVFPPSRD